ncbi:MAG TPA: hypothetical protein VMC79_15180 [Rectinemataceae bacterium]|nr:hypothetical protein [Rectinemataceae bacterium]
MNKAEDSGASRGAERADTPFDRRAIRRSGRQARYMALFDPRLLAATGLLVSLAFLFQPSLLLKTFLFALFFFAAFFSGKPTSPLATLLVSLGIIAANLLVPVGRVLVQIGPLRITEFALLDGIGKAVTFEGLIHISKASIRTGLRLPGRFGSIVASAFQYYDRIVEYKGSIHASSLVEDADRLMLHVWEEAPAADGPQTGPTGMPGGRLRGTLILGLVLILAYATLPLAGLLR